MISSLTEPSPTAGNRVFDVKAELFRDLDGTDNKFDDTSIWSESVFDDDDEDDDDENDHIVILSQRKRRDADDDSDESLSIDDISYRIPSFSDIMGPYLSGEDDYNQYRSKRDAMSDSSDDIDIDIEDGDDGDEEDDDDEDLFSDVDLSISLLMNRTKRNAGTDDNSSIDTFEEENDEIFDDVMDGDDSDKDDIDVSDKSDAGEGSSHRQRRDERSDMSSSDHNRLDKLLKQDSISTVKRKDDQSNSEALLKNNDNDMQQQSTENSNGETQNQDDDDDVTSSSDAKNSGPETESDTELSDIPLDEQSQTETILDRETRESEISESVAFEEGADPNSGENLKYLQLRKYDFICFLSDVLVVFSRLPFPHVF